ncbi:MAG TPA: hypothetical protein VEA36_02045 [Candidatus Paceibacterota bacterium]|nr:hypothetical protein [Candidatus Paceibacterota bacterium]
MTPFRHATAAALYIALLVTSVWSISTFFEPKETILVPMAVLGTLVFSAALMAYLFFAKPLILFRDGKAEEGIRFFLTTLGIFMGYVLLAIVLVFALSYL